MKIFYTSDWKIDSILARVQDARSKSSDVAAVVQPILADVQERGDSALCELTSRFDRWEASPGRLTVTREEIQTAYEQVGSKVIDAIKAAKTNIETFHKASLQTEKIVVETATGVQVWREFRPTEKVGLYVPGGKAAYPSTVLMLAVPAKIAGVKELVICTPAMNGVCNPVVLVAADICGVNKIYKIGGAQAVAAMAYGTATIPKVYKIVGPGNEYVTTAKTMVYGAVDIDMPAGPSEVAVLAGDNVNPAWVAADLLSQLEHGEDSQAVLVTFSERFACAVINQMNLQMQILGRKEIIENSMARSFAIVVQNQDEAVSIMNGYAPEHMEIVLGDEENELALLARMNNFGSAFLGEFTSEPLGDYATGANHTLPTSGAAKMFSALDASAFGKWVQVQRVSQEGLSGLRDIVEILAAAEELQAHARAVSIRFDS